MKGKNLVDVNLFINYRVMTQLSTNLRTHICYIKESNEEKEIHITEKQYQIIREDIENLKMNDFYKITDVDNWKTLFDWQRKDIIRFKEKNLDYSNWRVVICWYWNRHPLFNWWMICDCFKKYWFLSVDLKTWARDNNKSSYMQDLTEDDKRACWAFLNNKIINKNE